MRPGLVVKGAHVPALTVIAGEQARTPLKRDNGDDAL